MKSNLSDADETAATPPASPEWRVRIMDLSGGAEDGVVEDVTGFPSLLHANEFACRYVRDSIERCREAGLTGEALLDGWSAFGEDAVVLPEQDEAFQSRDYIDRFAATPAKKTERDWRALDPRRAGGLAEPDEGNA